MEAPPLRRSIDIPHRKSLQEDDYQAAVVQRLRRMGLEVVADQNAGRRSYRDASRRKAAGMVAGEPDLRIYRPGGIVWFIEMKGPKGRLTDSQRERFPVLMDMGFNLAVVSEATLEAAADEAERIVREWIKEESDAASSLK